MNCKVKNSELKDLFFKGLSYDYDTYRNYRNAVNKLVAMSQLDDKSKVYSIWFMGLLYNNALEVDPNIITEGLPFKISQVVREKLFEEDTNFKELFIEIKKVLESPPVIEGGSVEVDLEGQKATPAPVGLKEEYRGKLIYATPGAGKTTLADRVEGVVDADNLMIQEMNRRHPEFKIQVGETPQAFILRYVKELDNKAEINNIVLEQARELVSKGQTVVTGTMALIKDADIVVTVSSDNTRVAARFGSKKAADAFSEKEASEIKKTGKTPVVVQTNLENLLLVGMRDVAAPKMLTFNQRVNNMLRDLNKTNTPQDLYTEFKNLVDTQSISNSGKLELYKKFAQAASKMPNGSVKAALVARVNSDIETLSRPRNEAGTFLDLRNMPLFGVEFYIYTKGDGTTVEAVRDPSTDKYYVFDPKFDGSNYQELESISREPGKDHIQLIYRDKKNLATEDAAGDYFRMTLDFLSNGVRFYQLRRDPNDTGKSGIQAIADNTPVGSSIMSQVKLVADRREPAMFLQRLKRIQQIYPQITEENQLRQEQVDTLIANPQMPVVGFIRPTGGIQLKIYDLNYQNYDILETFDHLRFIYADNRTEIIDWNNPAHVSLFRSLVQVRKSVPYTITITDPNTNSSREETRYEVKYVTPTMEDLQHLVNTIETIMDMKIEIADMMGNVDTFEVPTEFTEQFINIANSLKKWKYLEEYEQPVQTLEDFAPNLTSISSTVKTKIAIRELNTIGVPRTVEVVGVIERTANGSFQFADTIPAGHVILDEDGNQINIETLFSRAGFNRGYVQGILNTFPTHGSFYLFKDSKNRWIPRPVKKAAPINSESEMVDFMLTLSSIKQFMPEFTDVDTPGTDKESSQAAAKIIQLFNNRGWGFNTRNGIIANIRFLRTYMIDGQPDDVYGIQFRAIEGQYPYAASFNANAKNMEIQFPWNMSEVQQRLKIITDALGVDMNQYNTLESRLQLGRDVMRMINANYRSLSPGVKKAIKDISGIFLESIPQIHEQAQKIVDAHQSDVAAGEEPYIDNENSFMRVLFVNPSTPSMFLLRNAVQSKNPLSIYKVFERSAGTPSDKQITVKLAQNPIMIDPAAKQLPVTTKGVDANITPTTEAVKKPAPMRKPLFSVISGLNQIKTLSDTEWAAMVADVQRMLGDIYGVSEEDLNGQDVDGVVLGMFADKVIRLNNTIKARGVGYHEAFHAIFRFALTKEQRQNYYAAVKTITGGVQTDEKGKFISSKGKKVYLDEFRTARRYYGIPELEIENLIYEEYLAEGFADFKQDKVEPKNALVRFFYRLLDKLMNLFGSKKYKALQDVKVLYEGIDSAKYRNMLSADPYEGPVAYELFYIPSYIGQDGNLIGYTMDSLTTDQIRNMIVGNLGKMGAFPMEKFDEMYDKVTQKLIDYYDIDRLVQQNPAQEEGIRSTYGSMFNGFRFLMGHAHRNLGAMRMPNLSGDPQYDNYAYDDQAYSIEVYNNFRDQIRKDYQNLSIIEVPAETNDQEDADKRETGTEADEVNDNNTLNDPSETGDRYDDGGILTLKPYEGSAEFRRLIRYISYNFQDKKLGVSFQKMVNSKEVINILRKTLANTPTEGLMSKLLQRIEFLEANVEAFNNSPVYEDLGKIPDDMLAIMEQADTLKAVYDYFTQSTGMDEDGNVTIEAGAPMFKMFHKVFEQANVPIITQQINTAFVDSDQTGYTNVISNVDLVEKRTVQNAERRMRTIIQSNLINLDIDGNQNYRTAKEKVLDTVLVGDSTGTYIVPRTLEAFDTTVDAIYRVTSLLNLNMSRALIEFSVAADTYRRTRGSARFIEDLVLADLDFYNKMQYMNPAELVASLKSYVDSILKSNQSFNREDAIIENYLRAALYDAKYDPTLFSVVLKNNEGKVISSYIPMTPSIRITLNIKRYGLSSTVDKHFPGVNSRAWFMDNPMFKAGMSSAPFNPNDTSPEAMRINRLKKFFSIMRISVAGGVTQTYGGREFQSTFRHLGEKSYFLSVLAMFMDRNYHVDDYNNKFETFERPITQFESTGTQFNVTGMYTNYAMRNLNTNQKKFQYDPQAAKRAKINNFLALLNQEYNRIAREYINRNQPSQKMEGYNGIAQADGTVDIDSPDLRAFNFNILRDFFEYVDQDTKTGKIEVKEIHSMLVDSAKKGISFEAALNMNLTSTGGKLRNTLESELLEYGNRTLQSFLSYLVDINVLKPETEGGIYMNVPDAIARYVRSSTDAPGFYRKEMVPLSDAEKAMVVEDFLYNFWFNSMFINQLFDGDIAVGIENIIDYFKRQKSGVAAGLNYRNALIPAELDVTNYAVVRSQNQPQDRQISGYISTEDPYQPTVTEKGATNTAIAIADGNAYTTIDRRIKKLDAHGVINQRLKYLLKQMRHRPLTYKEEMELVNGGIILNSDKPVIAAPYDNLKDSEHIIIRSDVSKLKDPEMAFVVEMLYDVLDNIDFTETEGAIDPYVFHQEILRKIHDFYKPNPQTELLHHFLNAMEYHRVDVLNDETVLKKGSPSPLVLDIAALEDGIMDPNLTMKVGESVIPVFEDGYLNLAYSKRSVNNELVYDQVRTSKIKETTTDSIQRKLLNTAGLDPKDPELKPISKDILAIRSLLDEVAKSRMQYLRRIIRASTDPAVFLTKLIERGMVEQGASTNLLKYYSIDRVSGKNVFNLNLPQLGKTPLFYFFSIFNRNVFSPKVSGKKYFHVSPLGYKIKGEDGKMRYPKVYERTVKINGEDVVQTVVEVIIPKELARSKEDREFFETLYSQFLAARVPTEERRSMIVAEVVGYVNAMYGNIIIVPSQMHRFAGSDFDIDTVFAEMPSYYRNVKGKLTKYGDYKYYKSIGISEEDAKFLEYLHFISDDPAFADLIQQEKDRINVDPEYKKLSLSNGASKFGNAVASLFNSADEDAGIKKGKKIKDFLGLSQLITGERTDISSSQRQILKVIERLIPAINVVNSFASQKNESQIPTTAKQLADFTRKFGNPVTPVLYNQLIVHNRNVVGFQKVFERYVKNFSADEAIEPYKKDAKLLSKISGNTKLKKANPFTFESVARIRALNKDAKYMLNAAANFNKAAAVMSTADTQLSPTYTFTVAHNGKKAQKLNKIGQYIERIKKYDKVKTALLVGGTIGMAADDGKNQIAGILKLNINTAAVLDSLYLYGYPEQFARLIHSVGMIGEAIDQFNLNNDPSFAEPGENRQSFTTFINTYTSTKIIENFDELSKAGLVRSVEGGTYEIDESAFTILYNDIPYNEDVADAESEDAYIEFINPSAFNITIHDKDGNAISEQLAEVVLLGFYQRMNTLGNRISFKIATLTSTLKSQAPSFTRLGRVQESIEFIQDNDVFTNAKDIFKVYPVLETLGAKVVPEMIDMSKDVLLDQTNLFKAVTGIFKNVYGITQDEVVAELKSVLMLSAMRAYVQEEAEKIRKDVGQRELTPEEQIILAIQDTYNPQYWVNNTIVNDLKYLVQREPNNEFLRSLRAVPARIDRNPGKTLVLESVNASRLSMEGQERMIDEFLRLINHEDERISRLAINIAVHGIVKDGSMSRSGGYMKVLAPGLFLTMSNQLDMIQDGFKLADEDGKRSVKTYLDRINTVFTKIYRTKVTGPQAMEALLVKMVSILTLNAQANRRLRMSFYNPSMGKGTGPAYYGAFHYIDNESLKTIIDSILPKNASQIYTQKGRSQQIIAMHSGLRSVYGRKTREWNYEFWKADQNEELFWDLSNIPDEVTQYTLDLLKRQGIYKTSSGNFGFPLYQINNYENGQLFILTEIDGKPFTEDLFTNLYNAYKEDGDFQYLLRGKTAKYKVVSRQGTPRIYPNAFSNADGQDIRTAIMGVSATTSTALVRPIPELPKYATVVQDSSSIRVNSMEEARALAAKTFVRDGVQYSITQNIFHYSTSPAKFNKGKIFLSNKHITGQDKLDQFAQFMGYANFNQYSADPANDAFLNPVGKGQSIFILSFTSQKVARRGAAAELGGPVAQRPRSATQPSVSTESKRTFKDEEYHQAYLKGGLSAVQKLIEKNKQVEISAGKQLSTEVEMLTEFEDLNAKLNKTNSENDRLIELYTMLKNSKELDFEYSLNQLGLSTQPTVFGKEQSMTLRNGTAYPISQINTQMLERMGYTPSEISRILNNIC